MFAYINSVWMSLTGFFYAYTGSTALSAFFALLVISGTAFAAYKVAKFAWVKMCELKDIVVSKQGCVS